MEMMEICGNLEIASICHMSDYQVKPFPIIWSFGYYNYWYAKFVKNISLDFFLFKYF